jgi:cytochrome c oxidase subunit 1
MVDRMHREAHVGVRGAVTHATEPASADPKVNRQ